MFVEGASINGPPMFCGVNYQFRKLKMRIFIESIDRDVWDAIVNSLFVPKVLFDEQHVDKPWSDWTDSESKKAHYGCITKNIVTSSLNLDEFFRVSQYSLTKEMWDSLEVTHEGINDVRRARKYALIQEYKISRMK